MRNGVKIGLRIVGCKSVYYVLTKNNLHNLHFRVILIIVDNFSIHHFDKTVYPFFRNLSVSHLSRQLFTCIYVDNN